MVKRLFLGWSEPFVGLVADWLLNHDENPEKLLVIVPTGQSARQLKHQMATKAGALLSPTFATPGSLMRIDDEFIAPDWLETLAWQEVLENQVPQSTLESLFSNATQTQGEWAGGLASEMTALRKSLQDNGLMLRDLARRLSTTLESERWDALSDIESKVEAWLRKQGYQSRSDKLRRGLSLPENIEHIILAGITELPPLVRRSLDESDLKITSLIAAPETTAGLFDDIGIPSEDWQEQTLSWPGEHGSVEVTTDPKQQAHRARFLVASAQTQADQLSLGSTDTEVGDRLALEFTSSGWPTHHPATLLPKCGLRRWLFSWNQWLLRSDLPSMAELLSHPLTARLIETDCAAIADSLAKIRDRWMVMRPDDLRHQLRNGDHRSLKSEAVDVIRSCEHLEKWQKSLEAKDRAAAMRHLLDALNPPEGDLDIIRQWIDEAADQMNRSKRPVSFWIELMLSNLSDPTSLPPAGRVLDVNGWLELLFQPGSHLVICGLNEGKVPPNQSGDPWLGESARKMLDLRTDAGRAARDAFLLQSMMHSRMESGGRVNLLCSRNSEKGEPMLPSRLLLAAEPKEIASRIKLLFEELEPVDAKLRWEPEADARWMTPDAETPTALNATSFRDYLACPFRYYLKHIHGMQGSEPNRIEWNARDFGNVIHNVLEAWGRDLTARQMTDSGEIHHWLNQQLDLQVQHSFNERIPLAVRIQLDAMRRRLEWFSQEQADIIANGWQVAEVEHKFEIPIGETMVRAKIDRIDRHAETGQVRIIDYKTGGKDRTAASAHRTKQTANSKIPAHIKEDDPTFYERDDGKKPSTYLWKDLQLPLYALAIHARDKQLATPCYFKLGETRKDVSLNSWSDFDEIDLEGARACAEWVSRCIHQKIFTPIAEKPRYDDYEILWCTRQPEEVMATDPNA